MIDLVMMVKSSDIQLIEMTRKAIKSLRQTADCNLILVETYADEELYDADKTILWEEEFNYNRCMNEGRKAGVSDYVCLCNNDVIFYKGWHKELIDVMESQGALSASPSQPNYEMDKCFEVGYKIGYHISGWCIMQHRSLYDIIGDLDEQFPFYYADNDYAETLKKHQIDHILVRDAKVKHLRSQTLRDADIKTRRELTVLQRQKYIDKWGL